MAFRDNNSFGALAQPSFGAGASQSKAQLVGDSDPQDVSTENLGFLALNGETKVKLLPQGFSSDNLPSSSSSLLAIANRAGLFAAAGSSTLIVGTTASLREAFSSPPDTTYTPQLSIPLTASVSHLAFNADESHLVLGASSGGLAIYSVNDLTSSQHNPKPIFELGTNGVGFREVKPNPVSPEFVAVVLANGEARMINLNERNFITGPSGSQVLRTDVGTAAWSARGKQIVCGLSDGTGYQMTPEGEEKAILPSVPGLENHFISSIVWLETNVFITTHTPVPTGTDENLDSVFHILTRSGSAYEYRKLPDPAPPYGMSRPPPYFYHVQIKQYGPNLKNMIIFANTCASEVGLVSRFSLALPGDPEIPADTFTCTSIGEDARRAQLPLAKEDSTDTSPIGMVLDLSAKDNVKRPVGGEEIDESPGPLPILMVLNNEGLLCAWHVIYNDAIEKREKYPEMMIYDTQEQLPHTTPKAVIPEASPFSTATQGAAFARGPGFGSGANSAATSSHGFAPPVKSVFGQPAFGAPSSLGSGQSAFGQPAFGAPSPLGAGQSAFGQPAFGAPSPLGAGQSAFGQPAFGAPSRLGAGQSVFGQSAFGAPSPLGAIKTNTPSADGKPSESPSSTGLAFGAYAKGTGFKLAQAPADGENIWGNTKKGSETATPASVFGKPTDKVFGGTAGFNLHSAFKDEASKTFNKSAAEPATAGPFGTRWTGGLQDAFGSMVVADQGIRDADMDADSDEEDKQQSDADEQEDIVTPGAAAIRSGGLAAPVTSSMNKTATPTAFPPPFSVFSTSAATTPPSNPFKAVSRAPEASTQPVKSERVVSKSPATQPVPVPEPAPLPPSFSPQLKAKKESPEAKDEKEPPLPPDFTVTKSAELEVQELPSSPESDGGFDEVPLPPDFTAVSKEINEEEKETPLPPDEVEEEEGEEETEEEEEGSEEGNEEEEENEEDEEDEEDEDEDDEDDNSPQPQKPGLFEYNLTPKQATSPSGTSNIFGSGTSYQATLEKGIFSQTSPFSSITGKTPPPAKSESASTSATKPPKVAGGLFGQRAAGLASATTVAGHKEKKINPLAGGGLFNKIISKPEVVRSHSAPVTANASPLFGAQVNKQVAPVPSMLPSPSGPAATSSDQKKTLSLLGANNAMSPALSSDAKSRGPTTTLFGPSVGTSAVSSPFAATPKKEEEKRVEEAAEESEAESEVDMDREYEEEEDEKIREQLQRMVLKPFEELGEFKMAKEVEVPDDFEAAFDSIYLSGNIMVNKLGQTVRTLAGYHLYHNQPKEGVTHESPMDITDVRDWRLCELEKVGKMVDGLLKRVKMENAGNEELEKMHKEASKGYIKLTTNRAEIDRTVAVRTDPHAAAAARARLLTPEQLLQQRQLRQQYTQIEKKLKKAEEQITTLKARIAYRDKNKAKNAVKPPTAEAIRNTIMKLTGMVERKSADVDFLEEKLRRLKIKGSNSSASSNFGGSVLGRNISAAAVGSPSRTPRRGASPSVRTDAASGLITPDRFAVGARKFERFATPERSFGASFSAYSASAGPAAASPAGNVSALGMSVISFANSPALPIPDPVDVEEAKEAIKARKAIGSTLKGALAKSGPRMTVAGQ
ncbi:hypothetical protein RUND412_006732 [Rhizina undulata]